MLGFMGEECTQQVFSDHFSGGSVAYILSKVSSTLWASLWSEVEMLGFVG